MSKIVLKNIYKSFGHTKVIENINLEVEQGEILSLLGESGCGKTTLLNIVGGLDRYTSGDLTINGVSTKDFNDYELEH